MHRNAYAEIYESTFIVIEKLKYLRQLIAELSKA